MGGIFHEFLSFFREKNAGVPPGSGFQVQITGLFHPAYCRVDRGFCGAGLFVKNTLIAEALKELTERKRNVILLSYFMEMSDADIAREMNLVRSTIHEHRTRSLEILRKIMEGIADEKDV